MKYKTTPTAIPRDRFDAVYRVLNEAIAGRVFPGCAFGVLAGGEVVLQDALGRFTYDEDAPAVSAQTVYDVASLTKVTATTAVAMLLYQRGLLDLDTPLGELLPGFVVGRAGGEQARHVKLRHLLAHNSGLPGYVEFYRTASTPAALLHTCLELPLEAEPGARAEYSDPGFILLGKALEVCTRESLASWVLREIFQPLKGSAGHAGLFSNVPDLLRLAGEILNDGSAARSEAEKPSLFDAATIELFSQRQGPEGSSRALGWDTPSENSSSGHHFSARSIGHLGYSGCSLWIDRDARVAVALLANRTWPDRLATASQLIRELRPAFHDAVREAL